MNNNTTRQDESHYRKRHGMVYRSSQRSPGMMKPLFNKHILDHHLSRFEPDLTDAQQQAAAEWAASVRKAEFLTLNEKPLQGPFLSRLFERVLGYRQVGHADRYFMKAETAAENTKGGKTPDARLGFFGPSENVTRAVVELKAPGADLDAKQHRKDPQTPVEQAFGYVPKFDGCRWVVVSNFVVLRLYRSVRGEGYYHEFRLAELDDEERLREFVFLLSRDNLIGQDGGKPSRIEKLASETHTQEVEITKQFYRFYHEMRLRLFRRLVAENPPPEEADAQAHEILLLEKTQKILDRVLFICFCEDTGLLPPGVIRRAVASAGTGFVRTTRWEQMLGLFEAIDRGRADLEINQYNGGLFAEDSVLRSLSVPDDVLDDCLRISTYDFETDLNVNILGHIFEQSITDLEALRANIEGEAGGRRTSKRKQEGVFYTPEFITRYIVEHTVGAWLEERFAELEARHGLEKIPAAHTQKLREAETKLWQDYEAVLRTVKVLDPACGSGAFLVACFDFLYGEFERVNRKLAELRSGTPVQRGLFDLDRQILQENLFGVDVNPESVEITKLSLWLKTARKTKPLDNLDQNIQCGNSLISPPKDEHERAVFDGLPEEVQRQAFDWQAAFPDVFERSGFDCVVGNPPYVRQEVFSPIKPYLEQAYASYAGTADLYTYFMERGVQLLRPGGKLSYIVSNKWLRAGYGEPLRRFFATETVFERLIDFGHAPIFEGADTFPCIIGVSRPGVGEAPSMDGQKPTPEAPVIVCPVPRETLGEIGLNQYVQEASYPVPWSRFTAEPWSLEPPAVDELMERIQERGIPLKEFAGCEPFRGVVTGFNGAFLIDGKTRQRLIREHSSSAEIIKPFLRGRNISRWSAQWEGEWMIFTRRGISIDAYPAVKRYLEGFRDQLEPKPKSWQGKRWPGRKAGSYEWYEIQDSIDYWQLFEKPKIIYQQIQFHPWYAFENKGFYGNDKTAILPTDELYLLAVLNSPLMWWHNFRHLPHMKDEALAPRGYYIEALPIADPTEAIRAEVEPAVERLITITQTNQQATRELLDWLRMEHGVETPGQKLSDFASHDSDTFVSEVKKRGGTRFTPAGLAELRTVYTEYAVPLQERRAEALRLEHRLSDLVNEAYGLTPEEIDLMWKTAPPRMPIAESVGKIEDLSP